MNTTIKKTDFSEISENLSRVLAYADYSGVDYFLIANDEGEVLAFQGNEAEERDRFTNLTAGEFEDFLDFCWSELDNIEEEDESYEFDDRYLVLTDEEADELSKRLILDSVWAFNPDFLSGETGIDSEVFRVIQSNGKCEDNNDAILSCIDDEDSFVEAAIRADGRGHFIASYDSDETEQKTDFGTFYIYRVN